MAVHTDKSPENKTRPAALEYKEGPSYFTDNRPETVGQKQRLEMTGSSEQVSRLSALGAVANRRPGPLLQRKAVPENGPLPAGPAPAHTKNNTGLPDRLKAGIERLSGFSMDDVKVHDGSGKPAQLQAHAYTQGADIHLGPGQERHLPHEAWHVVQQKQGRVQPTLQMKAANINDDAGLEKEADTMGARAATGGGEQAASAAPPTAQAGSGPAPIQRMLVEDIPIDKDGNAVTPGQQFMITTGNPVAGLKSVKARFIGRVGGSMGLYIFRIQGEGRSHPVIRGSNVEPVVHAGSRAAFSPGMGGAAAGPAIPPATDMDMPMAPSTGTGMPGLSATGSVSQPPMGTGGPVPLLSVQGPLTLTGGTSGVLSPPLSIPQNPVPFNASGSSLLPVPAASPGMSGMTPHLSMFGSGRALSPAVPMTGGGSGVRPPATGPMFPGAMGSGSAALALPLPVAKDAAAPTGPVTGPPGLALLPLPSLSANGPGLAPVLSAGGGAGPVADTAAGGSSAGATASVVREAPTPVDYTEKPNAEGNSYFKLTGAAGARAAKVNAAIRAAYATVPSVPKATLLALVQSVCADMSEKEIQQAILLLRKNDQLFPAFPGPNLAGVKNFSLDPAFTDGAAKGKKAVDKSLAEYIQSVTVKENIGGHDKHDKVRNTLIAVIKSAPDDDTWKVYRGRLIELFKISAAAKYYTDTYVRAGDEHEQLITSMTADQVLYDLTTPNRVPVTVRGERLTSLEFQKLTNVATHYIVLKSMTRHTDLGNKYSQNHHPTSKELISFVDAQDPEKLHGSPGSGPGGSPAYHDELAGKITGMANLEQLNKELMEVNIDNLAGRFDILHLPASQRVNQVYKQTDGTELHFDNEEELHRIARNVEVRRRKVLGLFRVVHELLTPRPFPAIDTLPMGARSPHEMDNLPATPERYNDREDDSDDGKE